MSLDAMADEFVTRKMTDQFANMTLDAVPPTSIMSLKGATANDPASGKKVTADNPASKFLSELTKYIPSEILSAYIALIALPPATAAATGATPPTAYPYDGFLWAMFWVCAVLSPIVVYVLAGAKARNAGHDTPVIPYFPMAASVIAFILWAAVLPNSVISHKYPELASWVGFAGVILGTVILSLANTYLNGQAGAPSSSGGSGTGTAGAGGSGGAIAGGGGE